MDSLPLDENDLIAQALIIWSTRNSALAPLSHEERDVLAELVVHFNPQFEEASQIFPDDKAAEFIRELQVSLRFLVDSPRVQKKGPQTFIDDLNSMTHDTIADYLALESEVSAQNPRTMKTMPKAPLSPDRAELTRNFLSRITPNVTSLRSDLKEIIDGLIREHSPGTSRRAFLSISGELSNDLFRPGRHAASKNDAERKRMLKKLERGLSQYDVSKADVTSILSITEALLIEMDNCAQIKNSR